MATSVTDFYKANPTYIGNAGKRPKKQTGKGGFLTSLISEGGAAGGAALGASIGSAVPGFGTVIGAGIGGLIGGFSGRLTENKIRDNEFRPGQAFGEGALSGALSAAGAGFQAYKGIKAAKGLTNALGRSDEVAGIATNALKQAPKTGMASRKGLDIVSKAGGYYARDNVPGIGKITVSKAQYYDDVLKKLKIPANDAGDIAGRVGKVREALGSTISESLKRSNVPLSKSQITAYGDDILKQVNKTPGLTTEAKKFAKSQVDLMKSEVKDLGGLHNFRVQLDDVINWNANPDSALAAQQGAAKVLRTGIRDRINNLVPGLKDTNKLFHDVTDIEKLALKASGRVSAEATGGGGGGLVSRVLSSPTANTAKAKAGRALTKVGPYTAGTGGFGSQVTNQALRQLPGNLVGAMGTTGGSEQMQGQLQPDLAQQYAQDPTNPQFLGVDPAQFGYPVDNTVQSQQQTQPQSAYTLEQAIADIQKYPKDAAKIQAYYKFVQDAEGGGTVSAAERKIQRQAESAMQGLQQLKQLYTQAGGGQNRLPGIAGNIQGKLGGNSKTEAYNRIRDSLTTSLARAFGETGVLTDQDREVYRQALPRIEDTPEEAAIKLQYLEDMLMQSQPSQAPSESDIYNALQGAY